MRLSKLYILLLLNFAISKKITIHDWIRRYNAWFKRDFEKQCSDVMANWFSLK